MENPQCEAEVSHLMTGGAAQKTPTRGIRSSVHPGGRWKALGLVTFAERRKQTAHIHGLSLESWSLSSKYSIITDLIQTR